MTVEIAILPVGCVTVTSRIAYCTKRTFLQPTVELPKAQSRHFCSRHRAVCWQKQKRLQLTVEYSTARSRRFCSNNLHVCWQKSKLLQLTVEYPTAQSGRFCSKNCVFRWQKHKSLKTKAKKSKVNCRRGTGNPPCARANFLLEKVAQSAARGATYGIRHADATACNPTKSP